MTLLPAAPNLKTLTHRFDLLEVHAIVLMGSYGRGEPGPFSDVDLVRFTSEAAADLPGSGSHLIDGRLVVVSNVTPSQVEKGFAQPEVAVEVIAGLCNGKPLIDKNNTFAAIRQRARDFRWDDAMQAKANIWASQQMVGWIEEVHKGLEGLRSGDSGRLLHAQFGCSWGLTRVMCVQRGVLLTSDNTLVPQVTEAMGADSDWSRLCRRAFGVDGAHTLVESVQAGLQLYVETAVLFQPFLSSEDVPLIQTTVKHIRNHLPTTDTH